MSTPTTTPVGATVRVQPDHPQAGRVGRITTIPAITLIQPWASLIACGAKRFETRSWQAPAALIGRTVAIHAGKNRTEGADLIEEIFNGDTDRYDSGCGDCYDMALARLMSLGLGDGDPYIYADQYPYGAVVCTARLTQCHRTRDLIGHPEAVFGDFSPGRYAWEFDEVRPLTPPVPCRGYQGIWHWDPATGGSAIGREP